MPASARELFQTALALHARGQLPEARQACERALAADSSRPEHHALLGDLLTAQRDCERAISVLRAAAARFPGDAQVWFQLGFSLGAAGLLEEAVPALQKSQDLRPHARTAHFLAGGLAELAHISLVVFGNAPKSAAYLRLAMAAQPDEPAHHSRLLMTLAYSTQWTPEEVFAEHLAWAKRHGACAKPFTRAPHAPGSRRIRVGYVSADFRNHPVAAFFEAIARHHDRRAFEVFCYSNVLQADDTTRRLAGLAEHWRPIRDLSDADAAELVRRDGIDILVDLSGHSPQGRLGVFAGKPAPVQVTYLGYPNTTGMRAVDHRIVDAVTDPPGMTERLHTEQLERLPGCFLCYSPPDYAGEPGPLPCLQKGHVTFGSFNNFAKVTPGWLALAARILRQVPGSKCMVKCRFFPPGVDVESHVCGLFAPHGIGPERLIVLPADKSGADHLARYGREVDIALDTFPYNGTTTTCEALWMGVPVVTLAGQTHVSRVSASLLTAAGLPELVASDPDAYVRIAVELACDPERLSKLRQGMRQRMAPLTDGPAFTAKLEDAYLSMLARQAQTVA